MKGILGAGGWLLLGCVISGCGAGEPVGRVRVGSAAPAFQAVSLAGDTVALSSLSGGPVLINLWATWCAPCRRETPYLQEVHERFGSRGLQVVGVSTDTRAALDDVRAFVEEFGVTYRVLHDPDGRSMDLFSAIGLPATYLIDGAGTVIGAWLGPVDENDRTFEGALEEAVRGSAGANGAGG